MGNIVSCIESSSRSLSSLEGGATTKSSLASESGPETMSDLHRLGQSMPFGDAELADLYTSHAHWLHHSFRHHSHNSNDNDGHTNINQRSPFFLYDWYRLRSEATHQTRTATPNTATIAATDSSRDGDALLRDTITTNTGITNEPPSNGVDTDPHQETEDVDGDCQNREVIGNDRNDDDNGDDSNNTTTPSTPHNKYSSDTTSWNAIAPTNAHDRMKACEEHILPRNFGNALYQACFCAPGDAKLYVILQPVDTTAAAAPLEASSEASPLTPPPPWPDGLLPPPGVVPVAPSASTASNTNSDTSATGSVPPSPTVNAPPPRGHFVDEYTRRARVDCFFEGLAVSSRRGAKQTVTALFKTEVIRQTQQNHNNDDTISNKDESRISARSLIETGYRIALATAFLQSTGHDDDNTNNDVQDFIPSNKDKELDPTLSALAGSIVEKGRRRRQRSGLPGCTTTECPFLQQGLVELEDVLEWSDAVAPMFALILPTFFHSILFPNVPFPRSRTAFVTPVPDCRSDFLTTHTHDNNKSNSAIPMNARIFAMACLSSSLTGNYHRLYASTNDGLSFNRLQNAILGYGGPTLLLIRSTSGGIFGAYTASSWKESKDFYGNTDCFLYQLYPCTAVYRPTGSERNFMYCNSTARSKGYDQQAHGIGFGGSVHEPRLFISESFDDCIAASQDLTFENGQLLPLTSDSSTAENPQHQHGRKHFEIDSLEVWGVGGADVVQAAFQARDASRAITDEAIRRARKVDKAQFLDDFRAGTFDSKAFQHIKQIDGRADCDLQDRNQSKDKVFGYAK